MNLQKKYYTTNKKRKKETTVPSELHLLFISNTVFVKENLSQFILKNVRFFKHTTHEPLSAVTCWVDTDIPWNTQTKILLKSVQATQGKMISQDQQYELRIRDLSGFQINTPDAEWDEFIRIRKEVISQSRQPKKNALLTRYQELLPGYILFTFGGWCRDYRTSQKYEYLQSSTYNPNILTQCAGE